LIIFSVRIVDVTLGTISTVYVIRGRRIIGSIFGFVDLIIWFLIVRQALSIDNASLWIAFAYAGGYAAGTYIGSWIEEKLAVGNSSIQIITKGERYDLVEEIRNHHFAVSSVVCQGKSGNNLLLIIKASRKRVKGLQKLVQKIAPDSFISISDVQKTINGYILR
jgi:uncharacterized protein YebE (UPF0316 family)